MKFVIQRVTEASVSVEHQIIGSIGKGFLVFIGISDTDTEETADYMLQKMLKLRLFDDDNGKTNLSLQDVNGELLLISQFTLYADCRKGNRPSFFRAGKPEHARRLYEYLVTQAGIVCSRTESGEFGADMKISLLNDGPFTVILDSEELC